MTGIIVLSERATLSNLKARSAAKKVDNSKNRQKSLSLRADPPAER